MTVILVVFGAATTSFVTEVSAVVVAIADMRCLARATTLFIFTAETVSDTVAGIHFVIAGVSEEAIRPHPVWVVVHVGIVTGRRRIGR